MHVPCHNSYLFDFIKYYLILKYQIELNVNNFDKIP